MTAATPESTPAERLFAAFLEQYEDGLAVDFEALCAANAELAPNLRAIHSRWLALDGAFAWVVGAAAPAPADAAPTALDPMLATIGSDRLRRYEVGDEIARGGMGRIVRAFDRELRREVALKLQRGDAADPRRRRRFVEEAQIAAQLDHPGIVPIHELGLDDQGRPFFAMQLVRGRDLGEILRCSAAGEAEWTRSRLLDVLLRVCEAMAFAHERGVVHRDLKPQNIMVGRFGETYVMDWGLARVIGQQAGGDGALDTVRGDIVDQDEGAALLTREGDVVGTPSYMAPEQAAGESGVAVAVDIYAVGAMLYQLIAGTPPYVAEPSTPADTVLQQVRIGPPAPLPDVAPELRAICEQAMARNPQQRYGSMTELASDLRAFLEMRAVRAYATGRFTELRKWVSRNRALTAAAAAAVLVLAIGSIAVTVLWMHAEHSRSETAAVGEELRQEVARSSFRSARQSLAADNSRDGGDALWRMHLDGSLPRASEWGLLELAERDPRLAVAPLEGDQRPVAFCPELAAVLVGRADGLLELRSDTSLQWRSSVGESGPAIMSLAVLPGSQRVVVGTARGVVRIVDLATGAVLRQFDAHQGSVRAVVAAANGGFATGGADGVVLWWADVQATPRTLMRTKTGVTSLALRPIADGVAVGDESGNLRATALNGRWDVRYATGARVTALVFGRDENELWVGSTDHLLRRYDFKDRSRNSSQPTRNGTCRQLAREADGSLLVGGWWRIDRFAADGSLRGAVALRGVSRFALDAENCRLVTSGASSGLGLVDLSEHDRRHLPRAYTIALSQDGRRLATVIDGQVSVQEVASRAELRRLPMLAEHLQLDGSGQLLAVIGGSPRRIEVFDVTSGERVLSEPGAADDPFGDCLAFAPGGREAAHVVGAEQIVRRARDGSVIGTLQFPGTIIRIAYSADASRLAAIGRNDNRVRLWELTTGGHRDLQLHDPLPGGVGSSLAAVALSQDGRRIAVGTWMGTVMVCDLNDPTAAIVALQAHAGTVWSLCFHPLDAKLLVSAGGSQGIACWDLDSGECCRQAIDDVVQQLHLADDGRTVACIVPDGGLLFDLGYRRRHVAATLDHQLARLGEHVALPADREAVLRQWAAGVLAEPWPLWR